MKTLQKRLKDGVVRVEVETKDDMWHLSQIIEAGDKVRGKTERKIRIGSAEDRKSSHVKRLVFLEISVEKVEFHKHSDKLRVSGKITQGPEDIPKGTYHTFEIEEGTVIEIEKERWFDYQLDKIKESQTHPNVLVVVFDREEAIFACLRSYGYEILGEIKGEVEKKAIPENVKTAFFKNIAKEILDYDARKNYNIIILASAAFWKDYLLPYLESIKSKILLATTSETGKAGLDEVLRRPEVSTALKEDRSVRESLQVEKLLGEIRKDNAVYGISEVAHATAMGAISELLVSESFIQNHRRSGDYAQIEEILKNIESARGKISIISTDAGKKLDGLGGIAAVLRFKVKS
ncbi:MAG: mRNA surveillance protein pelota [Candidatus Woesearchaeota archaeon]